MTEDAKNTVLDVKRRGLYAGLMIALLGPPIGGFILWFFVSADILIRGPSLGGWAAIKDVLEVLLPSMYLSYIIVGIPAIIVALYAGARIETRGWVSFLEMVILSLFCSVPFMFLKGEAVLVGLPSALLTAFILRYLMLRWGIMKRPAR